MKKLSISTALLITLCFFTADAHNVGGTHPIKKAKYLSRSLKSAHLLADTVPVISYNSPQTYLVGQSAAPLVPTSKNVSAYAYDDQGVNEVDVPGVTAYDVVTDQTGDVFSSEGTYISKTPPGGTPTVLSSGFTGTSGITRDAVGNIYVADNGANQVVEIAAGTHTKTVLGTGISQPTGIAVDAAGNVYVAEYANGDVKKILAGTNTTSVYATGFSTPLGLAIDNVGNIYVCDTGNSLVKEVRQDGGGVTSLALAFQNISFYPLHAFVDNAGTLLVSGGNDGISGGLLFYRLAGATQANILIENDDFAFVGVTEDPTGKIYAALENVEPETFSLASYAPQGGFFISKALPAGLAFNTNTGAISGTPQVTSASQAYTVTAYHTDADSIHSYAASATINITVNNAAAPNISYSTPITYPVNAPAQTVPANSGGPVGTMVYQPTAISLGFGFNLPSGVARAASGVIYVADRGSNTVKQITTGRLGTTQILASGFNKPAGIAVDALGNVYVADNANNAVKKIPAGGGTVVVWGSGFSKPLGLAVDAAGNVYVADKGNNAVKKISPDGSTTASIGSGFNAPSAVAVDGQGNVYEADSGTGSVRMINPAGTTTTLIDFGFSDPFGIALDAASNIYVTNAGDNSVYRINRISGAINNFVGSEFNSPQGICTDASGNLYISDTGNNEIREIQPTTGYVLNKFLPAGLLFDSATGIISGTPTTLTTAATYSVTAYNSGGNSSSSFSLAVTSDASAPLLSNLSISSGTLSPVFADYTSAYTATIANSVTSVTVTPTIFTSGETVKVNNVAVTSGTASTALPMAVGSNTITVGVLSADHSTSGAYTVTVTRLPSTNAGLAGLTTSAGTITPVFSTTQMSYSASVVGAVTSVTVTPTVADNTATVTVDGAAVVSGTASGAVALNFGANAIPVVVTAQDGTTTQTYTLTVTRLSNDVTLTSLTTSPSIPLTQISGPGYKNYTASVPNTTNSVQIIPVTENANATVTVAGVAVASGAASQAIALSAGDNVINTVVTAQDGTTATYIITITRAPSSDANLGNLTVSAGTLAPAFSTSTTSYTVSVAGSVPSITVTPTVADAATVKVNGVAVVSGSPSTSIPLNTGQNTITILLTAQDGTTNKTYTITVTKAAGTGNANLSALQLSSGTLSPAFSATKTTYTASVSNATTSITVTPTVAAAGSTVTVNGTTVASGGTSGAIALSAGTNTITTVVTTSGGTNTSTYVVTVTRALSGNDALSALSIAHVAISPAFLSHTSSYTAAVSHSTTSITITATTADPGATIKINGTANTSGNPSTPVALNVGSNTVTIAVTSQNGANTLDYTITVSRKASTDDALTSITLKPFETLTKVSGPGFANYTASVINSIASISVIPVLSDPTATITVNGTAATSGNASTPVALSVGNTTITTTVTAQDGVTKRSYIITVTRAPASNALLSKLSTTPGTTLTSVSGPGYKNYTASVANTVSSIKVTPTTSDPNATVKVNGTAVASGTASSSISLAVGQTTINTVVTAQDGTTTNTYIITITRASGPGNIPDNAVSVEQPQTTPTINDDGIIVHQAISPNGDGKNDFLTIENIGNYPDNKLMIMNRNGAMVFEAKGYDNQNRVFDGHSNKNGQMQQPGTYFYSLDYTVNAITKSKTGFIVLKY